MKAKGKMRMLKILVKARFASVVASLSGAVTGKRKKGKNATVFGAIVLLALIAGLCCFSVGTMFYSICDVLVQLGAPQYSMVIAVIYASLACVIGSVFAVKTQIFESGDNELLLSMPIPEKAIFISRMIVLLVINYVLEAAVLLPCCIIYGVLVGYSPLGFMLLLMVFVLLPFLTLALSTFVAWIISEIVSRLRHKTVATVVLFVLFMAAYIYLSFVFAGFMDNGTGFDLSGLERSLVFWWSADAIANGNVLSFLYFCMSAVGLAIVAFVALDRSFVRIITTKKTAFKVEYKEKAHRVYGAFGALVKKELLRFFTSVTYLLNTGVGLLMCLGGSVFLAFKSDLMGELVLALGMDGIVPLAAVGVCAMLLSTCFISAPSVSLDDRQMWLIHSSPVDSRTVVLSKLAAHMIICAPFALLCPIVLCIAYRVSFGLSVLAVLTVLVMVALYDVFGLCAGLKLPKFGWKNEVEPIKQGLASLVAMLGSMAYTGVMCYLGYKCISVSPYLCILLILAVSAALAAGLTAYAMTRGVKIFENLKK